MTIHADRLKKQLQHLAKKVNPTTHRSLQQQYFALKKKYKKQVKLMHKKYKNDLINEIDSLRITKLGTQSRRLEANQQTPKRKYGRRRNPHISGSMDTTFSTITL